MQPPTDGRGPTALETASAALVAAALFAAFAAPWIGASVTAIPDAAAAGNAAWGADARLIVWILAWVAHALVAAPARLFDAPIFHPVPRMLTGSEHLATSVLVSGPVYALTGNPVLAANLAAMSTYVLAATAGYALVRALGLPRAAAAVAAVALMLGPFQVPADLHVLQYPLWPLALVLLAAVRIERGAHPLWLTAAATLAAFSSYYVAAMAAALCAIESALAWRTAGRRAVWRLVAGAAPAFVLLALASLPYVDTPGRRLDVRTIGAWSVAARWVWGRLLDPGSIELGFGWGLVALAGTGLLVPLVRRQRPALRWWRWLVLVVAGAALAAPFTMTIGGVELPAPSMLLAATPLRANTRWILLAQIGLAGLAAEGAAAMLGWLGARATPVVRLGAAALLVGLVLVPRARHLADQPLTKLPTGASVPAVYRWLAQHASGPLLEPPGPDVGTWLAQADSMVLGTTHWLPLLNGHTGFPPWTYAAMRPEFARLPDREALQTLVDLTGLRWVLVRRARVSAAHFDAWTTFARTSDAVEVVPAGDTDLLLRVRLEPRRPWAAALARVTTPPGETALGTPLARLDDRTVRGSVAALMAPRAPAARRASVAITLRNAGAETWPAMVPPHAVRPGAVQLVVRWRRADAAAVEHVRAIPRDLPPGDAVRFRITVDVPADPGPYMLEIGVRQEAGAAMSGVRAAQVPVEVVRGL
ncbi:MAG TPA: hypothetical protein VNO26_11450 [Candidatus Limnocylindria bacterium]|nr:hypothetical protein [Candidatus Limnocylindria bacterium]